MWWLLWTSVRAISLKVEWKARLPRLLTARWRLGRGKALGLGCFLAAYGGRLATEAAVEPTSTERGCRRAKMPDERAFIGLTDGAMRGKNPSETILIPGI